MNREQEERVPFNLFHAAAQREKEKSEPQDKQVAQSHEKEMDKHE